MRHRFLATAAALRFLPADCAYLDDGERCTARPDGTTSLMAMLATRLTSQRRAVVVSAYREMRETARGQLEIAFDDADEQHLTAVDLP